MNYPDATHYELPLKNPVNLVNLVWIFFDRINKIYRIGIGVSNPRGAVTVDRDAIVVIAPAESEAAVGDGVGRRGF
jgi:hypothetical protein